MLDAIGDTAYWSTSAEVIAGLVVAVAFTDVARTETRREQIRWFGTLRIAILVAIAGGSARVWSRSPTKTPGLPPWRRSPSSRSSRSEDWSGSASCAYDRARRVDDDDEPRP